jgi:HSP20 family protein
MAQSKTNEREQQQQQQQQRALQSRGGSWLQRRNPYESLFTLNPFELMRRMTDDLTGVLAGSSGTSGRGRDIWAPAVEAFQDGNEFVVRAELPGMRPDDVVVEISEDAVMIHGERRQERQEQRGGAVVSEISYGEFHRAIPLPEGVIADSAKATFREGVLEIRMPAPPAEVSRGRRLEINEGSKSQSGAGSQSESSTQSQSGAQTQSASQTEAGSSSSAGQSQSHGQQGGQSR